jgi:stress response protein SCP2/tellurite resistance protein
VSLTSIITFNFNSAFERINGECNMTWYDNIANSLRGAVTSIGERAQQFRNQSFADSSMAALALVSMADGVLQPEERSGVVRCIQNIHELQYFKAEALRDAFDEGCRQATDAFGRIEVLKKIRKVRGIADQSDVVVKICIIVCKTKGGQLADCERASIREVIRELGLNEGDYDLGTDATTGSAAPPVTAAPPPPAMTAPAPPVAPAVAPSVAQAPVAGSHRPRVAGDSLKVLKVGERASLKAVAGASVAKVLAGFGWQLAQPAQSPAQPLTVSAFLFDKDKKLVVKVACGGTANGVIHSGNTGAISKVGDDEEVAVDFAALLTQTTSVVFVAASSNGQAVHGVQSLWVRLSDGDRQLARFDYTAQGDVTSLVLGRLYLNNGDWKVGAVGEAIRSGTADAVLAQIASLA